MKTGLVFCAVLALAASVPAASARPRLANLFDGHVVRPPASIPHAHAAGAPLPRPKPLAAAQTTPPAPAAGPVFPPVTPLE
jgi:hypothetical protein